MQRKGSIHAKVTEHLRTSHLQKRPKVGNNWKHRASFRAIGVSGEGSCLFWRGFEGCDPMGMEDMSHPFPTRGTMGWMHCLEPFITSQHDGEK